MNISTSEPSRRTVTRHELTLIVAFVVSAMAVESGNVYFGLWYPIVIAGVLLVVGVLFVPETFRRDISQ